MRYATALSLLMTGFSLAAPTANAELFQRHADGKIWKYDGRGQCTENACPGWTLIDMNPATQDIAAGYGGLYQLHHDGKIWRYDGFGQCTQNACPGWTLIDKNPSTKAIVGGRGGFYQLHHDGKIWKYDGFGQCTTNQCPGWILVDKNPATQSIVADGAGLFQQHKDSKSWKYDGRGQCTENACPGWTLIDVNTATKQLSANLQTLFQRHGDGKIWKYDGRGQCTASACPGWTLIDKNPATQTIIAGGIGLYQLHQDSKFWKYDGLGQCSENACPGWTLIDMNPATKQVSANLETVFQRHADGRIWKYDGRGQCTANACPGWTLIDKNPATAAILAVVTGPSPILGDLVAGSPLGALRFVQDRNGAAIISDNVFFSSANLCDLALRPAPGAVPLDQKIRARVADRVNRSPFKMRSDSSVVLGRCSAHAELLATGSPNVRITIKMPQSRLNLILTTPDIGPIGLPGSVDPRVNLDFDLELHTDVIVPLVSRQLLRSENAGGSSSNAHIVDQNISADVLTVINDVVAFFGGPDLLAGLTNDQTFQASELGNLLRRFNSQLGSLPPGVGFVPSYDRGSATLVLRTAQ